LGSFFAKKLILFYDISINLFNRAMRTIHRDIVSAVILSKDNKVLFAKKDKDGGGVYAAKWHIPGGGVDEGETQLEALIREIEEEVGIDILKCEISLLDDEGKGSSEKDLRDTGEKVFCQMKFNVYLVELNCIAEKVQESPGDDIVECVWVRKDNLDSLELNEPSIELFRRLEWL
jgi:8-oxo-dGTP pyrophosphatase MutT (NUDIX family)